MTDKPTPRTDAQIWDSANKNPHDYFADLVDMHRFARQLERENAELREVLDEIATRLEAKDYCGIDLNNDEQTIFYEARAALAKTEGK